MIDVKVVYEMIDYHLDKHIKYLEVIVKGHATPIKNNKHLKVCASVTSVTGGSAVLIDDFENYLKIEKGLYHFIYKNDRYDVKTQDTIDVVVCQLFYIYQRYPEYFKAFELKEKETEKCQTNQKSCQQPKRKRKPSGSSLKSANKELLQLLNPTLSSK